MDLDLFKKTEGVLFSYRQIKGEIANLEIEIDELIDTEYTGCCGISYGEKSASTNKISDPTANEVLKKEKIIERIQRDMRYKKRLLQKIDTAVESLEDLENKIVKTYYFSDIKRTWLQTGALLNMDGNYIRKTLRPKIINKISSLIWVIDKYKS